MALARYPLFPPPELESDLSTWTILIIKAHENPYLFLGFPTAGDDSLLSLAALRLLTRLCVGCVCMSDSLKSLYVGPITDKSFNNKAKTI